MGQDGKYRFYDCANVYVTEFDKLNPMIIKKTVEKKVIILGKIKGIKAYVVSMGNRASIEEYKAVKKRYGYPIRHLPLDWGSYSGGAGEFIVSENQLFDII